MACLLGQVSLVSGPNFSKSEGSSFKSHKSNANMFKGCKWYVLIKMSLKNVYMAYKWLIQGSPEMPSVTFDGDFNGMCVVCM